MFYNYIFIIVFRSESWLKAARREDLLQKNLSNYKLCESHFESKFIYKTTSGLSRLYDNAVPTLFCGPAKRSNEDTFAECPKKVVVLSGNYIRV